MKKFNIVVLDYSGPSVTFYENVEIDEPAGIADEGEKIEDYLREKTDHHMSNCSWMSSESEIEVIHI